MKKKSEGKARKCLILLGGRTSLLLCLFLIFQFSYVAGDSTVPEVGNIEIHQITQQSSTIKGVVKDQKDEPLIDVSIVVKGTTNGTASDFDGSFILDVPDNSTLVFSFIGLKPQEVRYTGQKTLNVVLAKDSEALDEVVVVGYDSQKKGEITSSVTSVKAPDFSKAPIMNPTQLVEGRVAGPTVSRDSTDPNSGIKAQMRDTSSLKSSSEPLVITDSMPGNMTSLNTIAPGDIEAINVLKDGSATAIYETRGNNGVIIVSTRRSQAGITQVDYSGYIMHKVVYKRPKILNGDEFVAYGKETSNTSIHDFDGRGNHYGALLNKSNFTHIHNLTATGGSGKINYRASLNYKKNDDMIRNTSRETISGSIAVNHRAFDDKPQFSFNLADSFVEVDTISDDVDKVGDIPNYGILYQAIRINLAMPTYKEDGSFWEAYNGYEDFSPAARIYQHTKKKEFKNLLANFKARYGIIPGLTAATFFAMERNNALTSDYSMREEYSQHKDSTNGRAKKEYYQNTNRTTEWAANYNTFINGVHNITGLLRYDYQDFEYERFSAENKNFLTGAFGTSNLEAGGYLRDGKAEVRSKKEASKLVAFFAHANYNYDGKYVANASIRREGSTKFGVNDRWAWSPSVSAGQVISREGFMESQEVFDVLEFRTDFGITGSLSTDPYMSLATYSTGAGAQNTYTGSWLTATYDPSTDPNPDLKWEKNESLNVGLDFDLLGGRLNGTIDWYSHTAHNLINSYSVQQPSLVYNTITTNVGAVRNRDVELTLGAEVVETRDFSYTANFTFSYENNKLTSLSNDMYKSFYEDRYSLPSPNNPGKAHRLQGGQPIASFFGYVCDDISPDGTWGLRDIDGGRSLSDADRTFIDNGLPKFKAGLQSTFTYKSFDFSFFLRGMFDYGILNEDVIYFGATVNIDQSGTNICKDALKSEVTERSLFPSYHLEKGNFLRIDNATLGYTFSFENDKYVRNLRIYGNATDLATIAEYSGLTPDVNIAGLQAGIKKRRSYPTTRTFTFDVNFGF